MKKILGIVFILSLVSARVFAEGETNAEQCNVGAQKSRAAASQAKTSTKESTKENTSSEGAEI